MTIALITIAALLVSPHVLPILRNPKKNLLARHNLSAGFVMLCSWSGTCPSRTGALATKDVPDSERKTHRSTP
jgi:hypothetical protein